MVVYPHIITPFNMGLCDICSKNNSSNLFPIKSINYKGLQYCSDDNCQKKVHEWIKLTTIPVEKLIDVFGPSISIRRTTGDRDSGWVIISDAFKESVNDEYWVKIIDKTKCLTKLVTITTLKIWNPSHNNLTIL
jgi:hypothetical protein